VLSMVAPLPPELLAAADHLGDPGPAADNLSATAFDPTPVASQKPGCSARRR
jgi:hypothetical protein